MGVEGSQAYAVRAWEEATVASQDHRDLLAHFPTGVCIVTTTDTRGLPYGMTCSSLASVCLNPSTVLVVLAADSRTLRHAQALGYFAVNILSEHAEPLAARFAAPGVDRFADVEWSASPHALPWLADEWLVGAADLRVAETRRFGDHVVVFAHLEDVCVWGGTPLLYGLRQYQSWSAVVEPR
jgi:flavin reductase (DIM6/NTAB) family NADH-FMN oxidoreductase RutF